MGKSRKKWGIHRLTGNWGLDVMVLENGKGIGVYLAANVVVGRAEQGC